MDTRIYINSFKTTLSSGVSPDDTTIPVLSVAAITATRSALSAGEYFLVTLDDGARFEIVKVQGFSGLSLTNCVRGQEGTAKAAFSQGTRVEARVTAGTLSAFARLTDRLGDVLNVAALPSALDFSGNSVLIAQTDDAGNPIVATKSTNKWRFPTYPTIVQSGIMAAAGTDSLATPPSGTAFVFSPSLLASGAYIIQFTSGLNSGLCRQVSSYDSSTISWGVALPNTVSVGDAYEIYQSLTATLQAALSAQDDNVALALIFSE